MAVCLHSLKTQSPANLRNSVSKLQFVQKFLWKNAGFDVLRDLPHMKDYTERWDVSSVLIVNDHMTEFNSLPSSHSNPPSPQPHLIWIPNRFPCFQITFLVATTQSRNITPCIYPDNSHRSRLSSPYFPSSEEISTPSPITPQPSLIATLM